MRRGSDDGVVRADVYAATLADLVYAPIHLRLLRTVAGLADDVAALVADLALAWIRVH